nr:O-methyltransferase [Paenibacillus sp. J31TS4]
MTQEQYADSLLGEDPELERVLKSIKESGMPEVSIAPGYGRLLTLLVKISGAKRILEIGALGGYSGICLARGLAPGGQLVSLELKEEYAQLAKRNLTLAGFGDCADYRVGEALDSLDRLEAEDERFDLFLIDADKGNYPAYLEKAIRLANPGALILGDNAFLRGKTLDPERSGPSVQSVRAFNERALSDERLEATLLPAYDGLVLARVRG